MARPMYDLLLLFRLGLILWIAWKAVLLLDCMNPLLAIFFAIMFMIGIPLGLDVLAEKYVGQSDLLDYYAATQSLRLLLPLGTALIGVYVWNCIEAVFIRLKVEKIASDLESTRSH